MKKLVLPLSICLISFLGSCTEKLNEKDIEPASHQMDNSEETATLIGNFDNATEIASALNLDEEIEILHLNILINKKRDLVLSPLMYDDCTDLRVDTAAQTYFYTLDFGKTNCSCADGKDRRGLMKVNIPIGNVNAGSSYTIQLIDYAVNDFGVNGEKTVVYDGRNTNQEEVYKSMSGLTFISPYGRNITLNSNKTKTWKKDKGENYFVSSGYANGNTHDNRSFQVSIDEDIKFSSYCENIIAGELTLNGSYDEEHVLNFGDEQCDNMIRISKGDKYAKLKLY